MTEDKGRGLFATKVIKTGDLVIAEKAIAIGHESNNQVMISNLEYDHNTFNDGCHTDLVTKCSELAYLKGVHALRISYLYDGSPNQDLKMPDLSVFINNNYK